MAARITRTLCERDSILNDVIAFFCRHLIGIGWYEGHVNSDGEFTAKPTFFGASGFLLQLHDEFPGSIALITAGHVILDAKKRAEKNGTAIRSAGIFDIWGEHSTVDMRIPFDIFNAPAIAEHDDGIDYAAIVLPTHVTQMLAQTTTPFTKKNWVHQSDVEFDFYAIVGLPSEDAEQKFENSELRKFITTYQNPAILFVSPCELPSNAAPKSHPQFIAKINNKADIGSIVGMSGGPILGFRKDESGLHYWPVAIQSSWFENKRIVVGTPLPAIAATIEQEIERFLDDKLA